MSDLHVRILARLAEIEAVAMGVEEKWRRGREFIGDPIDGETRASHVVWGDSGDIVALVVQGESASHIALHDPPFVLTWVAGLRELVDDIRAERHYVNDGDCWYTCPVATEDRDGGTSCCSQNRGEACDCGRDRRVARHLSTVAKALGLEAVDE